MGMCFGVKDAIEFARQTAEQESVTVLGQLVHNQEVLDDLKEQGVQFAHNLDRVETDTVMVTAHGTSERRKAEIIQQGFALKDSTCPLVKSAHERLQHLVDAGYYPVIIGQAQHVEVRGLVGDFEKYTVVLTLEDVAELPLQERFGIVSQTTQPIEHVRSLVRAVKNQFPQAEVRFEDTVCKPTKNRQTAAVALAKSVDVVVVIGGVNSNNTHQLVKRCARYCDRVFHVQNGAGLQADWFVDGDRVGITAGTSTPESSIQDVEDTLKQFIDVRRPGRRGVSDRDRRAPGAWGGRDPNTPRTRQIVRRLS